MLSMQCGFDLEKKEEKNLASCKLHQEALIYMSDYKPTISTQSQQSTEHSAPFRLQLLERNNFLLPVL